MATPYVEIAL